MNKQQSELCTQDTHDHSGVQSLFDQCDFIKCLSQEESNFSDENREIYQYLRRENVDKPVFFIGAGTCGLGAGAAKTLKAVKEYLKTHNIEGDIVEVGCIGLCSAEPILDIQIPGRNRLSFSNITENKVEGLLSSVLNNNIPMDMLIGQHNGKELKKWENVPLVYDHPFFAFQTRWVLKNCGMVDPASIKEYIANGGYKAFAKAINKNTQAELCEIVEKSGLRGRGGGGFQTGTKWKNCPQYIEQPKVSYMQCR